MATFLPIFHPKQVHFEGVWLKRAAHQVDDGDAQSNAQFFLENGFLFVDNVLAGVELAAAQSAYTRSMEPEREAWAAALASNAAANPSASNTAAGAYNSRYFDLPRIVEQDKSFLDIVTHPRIISVLQHAIGEDVQVLVGKYHEFCIKIDEFCIKKRGIVYQKRGMNCVLN